MVGNGLFGEGREVRWEIDWGGAWGRTGEAA